MSEIDDWEAEGGFIPMECTCSPGTEENGWVEIQCRNCYSPKPMWRYVTKEELLDIMESCAPRSDNS